MALLLRMACSTIFCSASREISPLRRTPDDTKGGSGAASAVSTQREPAVEGCNRRLGPRGCRAEPEPADGQGAGGQEMGVLHAASTNQGGPCQRLDQRGLKRSIRHKATAAPRQAFR